jgi:UDP-glucose 4-epimerase
VETSVQELYDTMAQLAGFEEPARYAMPRPGELQRSALDPGRAAIHLGWKPWTDLGEGLQRTLEWFRDVPVGARR